MPSTKWVTRQIIFHKMTQNYQIEYGSVVEVEQQPLMRCKIAWMPLYDSAEMQFAEQTFNKSLSRFSLDYLPIHVKYTHTRLAHSDNRCTFGMFSHTLIRFLSALNVLDWDAVVFDSQWLTQCNRVCKNACILFLSIPLDFSNHHKQIKSPCSGTNNITSKAKRKNSV